MSQVPHHVAVTSESGLSPPASPESVPLVSVSKKTPHMTTIFPSTLDQFRLKDTELKGLPSKTKKFYENQNKLIDTVILNHKRYEYIDNFGEFQENPYDSIKISKVTKRLVMHGSFGMNILILVLNLVGAILSGSMVVIAAVVDSCLDILSGIVLYVTERQIKNADKYEYPEGKRRIEPIGLILFSCLMAIATLQIIIQSGTVLINGIRGQLPDLAMNEWIGTIFGVTLTIKFFLMLFCRFVFTKFQYPPAHAYAEDHRNDLLLNGTGVVCLSIAVFYPNHKLWFFDSGGAILACAYIFRNWALTALEQINFLTGKTAPPDLLKELTYIAFNHSEEIKEIDTVRAYHFGSNFLVELDIVLPEEMPLKQAHNIGESLQKKIEKLDQVERAFVHLDFESTHSPEH